MKRRLFFVAVLAALISGAVFLLGHNSGPQSFRLRIVRHAMDQGKPVVYFRVEGGASRRIQMSRVERIIVESNKSPPLSSGQTVEEFQAALPQGPISVPDKGRKEFGVFVPTNAAIWKLTVTVDMDQSPSDRLRAKLEIWRFMRKRGYSVYQATKNSWQSITVTGSAVVESEPITNSVQIASHGFVSPFQK